MIKTNLTNLIFNNPTISLEKFIVKSVSLEASMIQGNTSLIPFIDDYKYDGFLLRAKKFVNTPLYGNFSPYGAVYLGNLNRDIYYEGYVDHTGFVVVASKKFKDQSIRGGGSAGLIYSTKSKIIFDAQTSLGYGKYLNRDKGFPTKHGGGYLDIQIWFSVGYGF